MCAQLWLNCMLNATLMFWRSSSMSTIYVKCLPNGSWVNSEQDLSTTFLFSTFPLLSRPGLSFHQSTSRWEPFLTKPQLNWATFHHTQTWWGALVCLQSNSALKVLVVLPLSDYSIPILMCSAWVLLPSATWVQPHLLMGLSSPRNVFLPRHPNI